MFDLDQFMIWILIEVLIFDDSEMIVVCIYNGCIVGYVLMFILLL